MRLAIGAVCLCCTLCPAQAPNTLTPAEKAAGWRLLFDGQTLSGWRDPARMKPPGDAWTIEDGCIQAVAKPRVGEDLITDATFTDFEMVFDWRLAPGANSGVKYLIQRTVFLDSSKVKPRAMSFEETIGYGIEKGMGERSELPPGAHGENYVISFEYQLIDDVQHSDAQRGRQYAAGSLYGLIAPSEAASRPIGEFNQSRLVVRGDHVEHWLNGVKVVDASLDSAAVVEGLAKRWKERAPAVYELLTKRPRRNCPIALQNHGDTVWFRNLKIRPL